MQKLAEYCTAGPPWAWLIRSSVLHQHQRTVRFAADGITAACASLLLWKATATLLLSRPACLLTPLSTCLLLLLLLLPTELFQTTGSDANAALLSSVITGVVMVVCTVVAIVLVDR
eukprot:GHUV01042288.1.p1 GENE.GHUV01042288.1~~GHUV01042288.1.p1  ORF type:complete len:116 (+),score=30.46 GHUV01042288.1:296-643(+)